MTTRRWLDLVIRVGLSTGLASGLVLAARQGIAAWYFGRHTPEALAKAIRWDPQNPEFYVALARLEQFRWDRASPREVVRLYETATRLSPYQAQYWAELGGAYEWAGQTESAFRAIRRAEQLFPNSPDINWKLGNFYVRNGEAYQALRALEKTVLGDPEMRRPAFELAWAATGNNQLILEQMVPSRTDVLLEYLSYLIDTKRIDEAEQTWDRLLDLHLRFEIQQAFPYLDALIQQHQVDRLAAAWDKLSEYYPTRIRQRTSDPNLVTNGSFEREILNGGLDWRVVPTTGAVVSVDTRTFFDGVRSLRIEFDGRHNLEYFHAFQYIPVKPGTRYGFTGYMRVQGVTTDSGPRFQIYDAYDPAKLFLSTENLLGTSGWSPQHLEFETRPDTRVLVLRIARPASGKLDNQVAGKVWIDRLSLKTVE